MGGQVIWWATGGGYVGRYGGGAGGGSQGGGMGGGCVVQGS